MVIQLLLVQSQLQEAEQEEEKDQDQAHQEVLAVVRPIHLRMVQVVQEFQDKEIQEDNLEAAVKTLQVQEQTEEQVILLLFQVHR